MNESKNGRCACAKTDETIGSRSICSPIVPSRCSLETFQLSFPRATAILFKSSLHYCFPPPLVPTSHLSDSIPPSRRSESIFRFFHYGDCRFLWFIGEFWRTDLEYLGFFYIYLFDIAFVAIMTVFWVLRREIVAWRTLRGTFSKLNLLNWNIRLRILSNCWWFNFTLYAKITLSNCANL